MITKEFDLLKHEIEYLDRIKELGMTYKSRYENDADLGARVTYQIFDKKGKQVLKFTKLSSGNIPFRTGTNFEGAFTIKDVLSEYLVPEEKVSNRGSSANKSTNRVGGLELRVNSNGTLTNKENSSQAENLYQFIKNKFSEQKLEKDYIFKA